jgi:hypothetical protein
MESWISDDLAETILQIVTNLKVKAETRIMLTDITREEPDASLFEIPPDYKIGPAPSKSALQTQAQNQTRSSKGNVPPTLVSP